MSEVSTLICTFCRKEIREDEHLYRSRQAGMKGWYHWDCFVEACRQANRRGTEEIQGMTGETVGDFINLAKTEALNLGPSC